MPLINLHSLKEFAYEAKALRALISAQILARGVVKNLLSDTYGYLSDFCWLYRVPGLDFFKMVSYPVVKKSVLNSKDDKSLLESAVMRSNGKFSVPPHLSRDMIVLKRSFPDEKGVILLKYTPNFEPFAKAYDLDRILEKYTLVLEPSWAGYCDPGILLYASRKGVLIQCFTDEDFEFIEGLGSGLVPIRIGPADWVNAEVFAPARASDEKFYDIVMVANWGHYKKHDALFSALKKIRSKKLNVLLIGFEWNGRTKLDIIREAKKIDNDMVSVEIAENLAHGEVASCVRKSRMIVFLSRKEGDNKSIVEAFFCNVPALVYSGSIGGARNRINAYTGTLSSYEELDSKILWLLERSAEFAPAKWAIENTGSHIATRRLNGCLKELAAKRNEKYSTDIAEKTNSPNLEYKNPSMRALFSSDYRFINSCRRTDN